MQDKLFLPGLRKLKRLIDGGFFGRILSVRGEFGYWVFEGDWQPAQRPSWNYRAEDGGGIVVDMFPHWHYVLEELFGRVTAVSCVTATHVPERVDEAGQPYAATADDAAYAIFELDGGVIAQINSSWAVRVYRDELVEFQVDGTEGSAVAGLRNCRVQHRAVTPKPVWNPDLPATEDFRAQWHEVPDNEEFDNGFKAQWEAFLRHVVAGEPFRVGLPGRRPRRAARRAGAALGPRGRPHRGAGAALHDRRGGAARRTAHRLAGGGGFARPDAPATSRIAYAAAHVVADPGAENVPGAPAAVDWDTTLAFRRHLWSYGLGVAEAMDTAQRGMGLDYPATRELIRRSAAEARAVGGRIVAGVGTDQLPAGPATLAAVTAAYAEQLDDVARRRRPAGADVQPAPGRRGPRPGGLPAGLRRAAERRRRTGGAALAGPDVRPGADRLLGCGRPGPGRRHGASS